MITRLVPPDGNLVQGQPELTIDPGLAAAAGELIAASQNHYSPAEGVAELRRAVAGKIGMLNGVEIDPDAVPLELLITPGATGGLIAIAATYLKDMSALVFEPYYPYHRRIIEELGGRTQIFTLDTETLRFDREELRVRCRELRDRREFPLRAIIACTPVNPTGKVFTREELQAIADVCQEFDLLCIADEVYEHYVTGPRPHLSIASLPGMWERTITVNSFSKSWNISGWRLGYAYGHHRLVAPLNNANNVFYVCAPTPLQKALAQVLMADPHYYARLREKFISKRLRASIALAEVGFRIYDSGSAFYIWARIPERFDDAMPLNQALIERAGVAGVPGSAFTDSDQWDAYMRLCIAREDDILEIALSKLTHALAGTTLG
ncbi:MAG: aminotransferase class I/II-fold pyridoxal phosphate-dependent enzyme [Pyrinomonadaceae bacterium]|nr:aminotransferase class I/II-fold pyridoxal phosphate-dependent enzyme [Pyrinomonadaceae bacterium]